MKNKLQILFFLTLKDKLCVPVKENARMYEKTWTLALSLLFLGKVAGFKTIFCPR
jgi:hypothetical protein